MAQLARFRSGALALPDAEEGTHFGMAAFSVRGKRFASLSKDGVLGQFRMAATDAEAIVAEQPDAAPITRQGTTIGVSVPLAGIDVRVLDRLLRRAWEANAPTRLVAAHSAEDTAERTTDLPNVGRPAAAALSLARIATLHEVAEHTEAELLALHGVGPKAVRILGEALSAAGLGLRAR